jgi:class 3 adenylate cyclase
MTQPFASTDLLLSYAPRLLLTRLQQSATPPPEQFTAVLLMADISGFTALSEQLAEQGSGGAEQLTAVLNHYFGQFIEIITAHGGDVVKFAGDGLLAVWPVPNTDGATAAVLQVAQAALLMQQRLAHPPAGHDALTLALRIGVALDQLHVTQVGGALNRWEMLLAGPALWGVRQAERQTQAGQVLLAPAAWKLIAGHCQGEVNAAGFARLTAVRQPPQPRPLPPVAISDALLERLQAYIPGSVRHRLEAGQSDWLGEIRRLTVLFVNLSFLFDNQEQAQVDQWGRRIQEIIYSYEGHLNKISHDDKGVTLVVAFGLPPLTHEDDSLRALLAAQEIYNMLRQARIEAGIGVASGRAFCGSVGNRQRREYTMIGSVVNLAARLMQQAGDQTPILCDQATRDAAAERLLFEALPPLKLKGLAAPLAVYHLLSPRHRSLPLAQLTGRQLPLIGREAEQAELAARARALNAGQSSLLFIEGEAGIGKSRLMTELMGQAAELNLTILAGAGDALEKNKPYHAWRPILTQLMAIDAAAGSAQQRQWAEEYLARMAPDKMALAPLLNAILPLEWPETALTAQMMGEVRAINIYQLIASLLQREARQRPILLLIEDAHWLDSASWQLTWQVWQEVEPLLLTVCLRPFTAPAPVEYGYLTSRPDCRHLHLGALPAADIGRFVAGCLGVAELPEPVHRFIWQRAEGHPLFSEELSYALRDAGIIEIENGRCRLAADAGDLNSLDFPDTVQGVITSRLDRLEPQQQLILKVASVIGRVFAYRLLRDVHPIEMDRPQLGDYLRRLEQLEITQLESPEPELSYIFKHIVIQEVAYNLMAFAQRRQLHQTIADWYEKSYSAELAPYYPLLAFHYQQAQQEKESARYYALAGEEALRNYANQEAARFLAQALELAEKSPGLFSRLEEGRRRRQLGAAYYELGQLAESKAELTRALTLLATPLPEAGGAALAALLRQVGRQLWQRLRPRPAQPGPDEERIREAAQANALISEVLYFTGQAAQGMATAMRALNLAGQLGPGAELARAYTTTCLVASFIPLHPAARLYARLALTTAQASGQLAPYAYALNYTAVYALGCCQWETADRQLIEAMAVADRLGDRRQWITALAILAVQRHYQGCYEEALALNDQVYQAARRTGNLVQQGWGLYSGGENLIRLGRLPEALARIAEGYEIAVKDAKITAQMRSAGVWALAAWQSGDVATARRMADVCWELLGSSRPNVYSALEAYSANAEVYLGLLEQDGGPDDLARAEQSCRVVERYARPFALGQARAQIYRGLVDWARGRPAKANGRWQKALATAARLNLPYDEGRASYELGRHLPAGHPQRAVYLERAAALQINLPR